MSRVWRTHFVTFRHIASNIQQFYVCAHRAHLREVAPTCGAVRCTRCTVRLRAVCAVWRKLTHDPFPYQTLSGVFATNSGIAPHAALPHPFAIARAQAHMHHVWVSCGTACGTTPFARYCHVTPAKGLPRSRLWRVWWRCAAGRRARLDGPFGTIPGASDMPVACTARCYTWHGP